MTFIDAQEPPRIHQREEATAPAAPPARRARVDASTLDPTLKEAQLPLAYALSTVERHTASLHEGFANYLTTITKEWLSISHKIEQKKKVISKMEDPDYVPLSARVKFALKSSDEVEQQAEFTSLQEHVNTAITTFQTSLKTQIVAIAKLELKAMQQ